jgi:ketosteroid isomerase-like protein
MASARTELIERSREALNRGDFDASVEALDENFEWVVAREHPAARTIRTLDELRDYHDDWAESMPGLRFDTERIVEDGDRVVLVGTVSGTGGGSGAAVEVPIALVYEFRGDSIVRVEEFLDPAEAFDG